MVVKKRENIQTFKVAVSRHLETVKVLCKICFKSKGTTKSKFTTKVIDQKSKQAKMVMIGLDRDRQTVSYSSSLKAKCFKMGLTLSDTVACQ